MNIETLSPNEVISTLWNKNSIEKCRMGLADVVIYDRKLPSKWFITGKTGEILKKRAVDRKIISERWKRIAAQNDSNVIAIIRQKNKILKFLNEDSWNVFCDGMDTPDDTILSVHCYVRSNKQTIYRNKYELKDRTGRYQTTTSSYSYTLEDSDLEAVTVFNEDSAVFYETKAANIRGIMDLATNTVIRYLELMLSVKILTISIDYVIDSKSQLWMLWTSEATFVNSTQLAELDAIGLQSGDRTGRMGWAGPKYFEGELEQKLDQASRVGTSTSQSRASKSPVRREHSYASLENAKVDAATTAIQLQSASIVLDSQIVESKKHKRHKMAENIVSPRNQILSADNTRLQGSYPDPFKCKGDYCNVIFKHIGSLSTEQSKHSIERFFTPKELLSLRKDKNYGHMMEFNAANGPALAAVAMKSIIDARHERRSVTVKKEEVQDWQNYPITPRTREKSIFSRSVEVVSSSNQVAKVQDNNDIEAEIAFQKRLEADRDHRENFSKTMANYYDQVRVCPVCYKVYMVLDWARDVLSAEDKNKLEQIKPKSNRRMRDESAASNVTSNAPSNAASSNVSLQDSEKDSNKIIRSQSTSKVFEANQSKSRLSVQESQQPSLQDLSESLQKKEKEKKTTWKSYKDKEFSKQKRGEKFDADKFADLDDYLRGGSEALNKRKEKEYQKLIQSRINKLHQTDSLEEKGANKSAAENMYLGKVLVACEEGTNAVDAKLMLESAFFTVKWVPDGRSALNELLLHDENGVAEYDCVLVERDLILADAFELASSIRAHEKTKRRNAAAIAAAQNRGVQPYIRRLPIICLTSKTKPEDLKRYMEADMDGCVSLPFQKAALINTVRAAIPHHLAQLDTVGEQKEVNDGIPPDPYKKTYKLSAIGTLEGSTDSATIAGKMMAIANHDDNSTVNGMVQLDADTRLPYMVMDFSKNSKFQVSSTRPFFNLVVCHDLFDTAEKMKIFLRSIAQKYLGMQILLWNYPGQAFTEWRPEQLLNNEYHATCLNEVIGQVGQNGTKDFDTSRPFYFMGFGHGTSVISFYASHYNVPNMRGVINVNGWSYIDSYLAGVMHDCINVFQSAPAVRPDLPVYFFSRFLFSKEYLARVSVPLALNIYTAVHNPISLSGRINLCKGVLQSVDVRNVLKEIDCPVICIQSTQDAFCRPLHTEPFVLQRGGEVRSIFKALTDPQKTCVIWTKAGHEIFQENKKEVQTLIEQILTGFHETHDISFPAATLVDKELNNTSIVTNKPGEENAKSKNASIEDKFIDNVLNALKSVDGSSLNRPGTAGATSRAVAKPSTDVDPAVWEDYAVNIAEGQVVSKKAAKKNKTKGLEESTLTFDPTSSLFEKQENMYGGTVKSVRHPSMATISSNVAEYPEVKEYMSWRLKRNKKRLQRLQAAARTIQGAFRSHIARQFVHGIRRRKAAMTIQRSFRGWLGRCRFLDQARRVWASLLIQRAWRGYLGRKWYFYMRLRIAAAAMIQKYWRGYVAREFVKALRRRRHLAACTIQSLFRRNQARRDAWRRRERRNAATHIQRIYRGHLGKRKANSERDKYIFSKSQSQGIEFGRQMLLEHKLHATRLQSEITLLTQEKVAAEEQVEALLEEITSFEEGVRLLEKEMHQLSKVEADAIAYMDEESKYDLRDQKMRLDREFSDMLGKISQRKDMLSDLESKLSSIDKSRQRKEEEMRTLERKLVVLLEEQQNELNAIKKKQDVRKALLAASHEQLASANVSKAGNENALVVRNGGGSVNSANSLVSSGGHSGPSLQEKKQAAQLMQSTETLMKFGFMSMSMTYFSSLNMIKALRTVAAQDTVMAALADIDTQKSLNKMEGGSVGSQAGGESLGKGDFLPDLKKGQLPGQESLRVSAWSVEDVSRWLQTLCLGQYAEAFIDAAVDGEFLYDINDDDLKNTLGVEHRLHRKKILTCVHRLKIAEAQRDARVATFIREMGTDQPQLLGPDTGFGSPERNVASLPQISNGVGDANKGPYDPSDDPARRQIDGPKVSLEELFSYVRHSKYPLIKEALDYLKNCDFDPSLIRLQYLSDTGTVYVDGYDRLPFHINKTDEHGNTMLTLAAQNGNMKVTKYLMAKGANPNHQNNHGQTPAHFAIAYQFFELSQWLFENGAIDTLENKFGLGPYDGLSSE